VASGAGSTGIHASRAEQMYDSLKRRLTAPVCVSAVSAAHTGR
jgi:hypothetical protein